MKWRDTNDERQEKILHRETQASYYFEQKIGQNQKSMKRSLVTIAKKKHRKKIKIQELSTTDTKCAIKIHIDKSFSRNKVCLKC